MVDQGNSKQPALLFVDILGSKAVWTKDGCDGAAKLFDGFAELIGRVIRSGATGVKSGAIESDCAALICKTVSDAVELGSALYREAFFKPKNAKTARDRVWLRGVIVPVTGAADVRWLRRERPLADDVPQVAVHTYGPDLLDAISMEKAGFKGMRLLLDGRLHDARLDDRHLVEIEANGRSLSPFKHLTNSVYGTRLQDHLDVLWMADGDADVWQKRRRRMSSRMRYSASTPDEVLQAAATQVVFDECDAIMNALLQRPRVAVGPNR